MPRWLSARTTGRGSRDLDAGVERRAAVLPNDACGCRAAERRGRSEPDARARVGDARRRSAAGAAERHGALGDAQRRGAAGAAERRRHSVAPRPSRVVEGGTRSVERAGRPTGRSVHFRHQRPRSGEVPPMAGSVIIGGARTPIGKLSGGLAGFAATDLGGFAIKAALERAGVSPEQVDYVFMGQVLQAGTGQITARQAAANAGIPMTVPATTINKVCLSGLNSIYLADLMIQSRRGRHRRGRGHGVHDQGPLPPPRGPGRLPAGRQVRRRLDDVRRPLLRLRPGGHGRRHREVRGVGRPRAPAPGRALGRLARAGGQGPEGRPVRRRDRPGRGPPAQG